MIPGVNIISRKSKLKERQRSLGSGGLKPLCRDFRGQSPLRKVLGSKELKIESSVAEIITVQDYKRTKNANGSKDTYTVSKLRVKQVTYESKI